MKKTRVSCLLAALLMLASCGAPAADETTADTAADTAAESETAVETDALEACLAVPDDLGEKDFGGEEYRVMIQER